MKELTTTAAHVEIDLNSICGAFAPMYFLTKKYQRVVARNLKKRLTSEISSIQRDERGNVYVIFNDQKIYALFQQLTVPMKQFLMNQFLRTVNPPPHVSEIIELVKNPKKQMMVFWLI